MAKAKKAKTAKCCLCLVAIPAKEYFAFDFYCEPCAAKSHLFPLRTTE